MEQNNNRSRKKTTFFAVVFILIIPILNSLLLSPLGTISGYIASLYGNNTYSICSEMILLLVELITNLSIYTSLGLIFAAMIGKDRAKMTLYAIFTAVSMLLIRVCSLLTEYFLAMIEMSDITTEQFIENLSRYILYMLLTLICQFVLIAVIWLISSRFSSRADAYKKSALTAVLGFGIVNLVLDVIDTISMFIQYGLPINLTELIYIVSPYIKLIIYAGAGYFLMLATMAIYSSRENTEKL